MVDTENLIKKAAKAMSKPGAFNPNQRGSELKFSQSVDLGFFLPSSGGNINKYQNEGYINFESHFFLDCGNSVFDRFTKLAAFREGPMNAHSMKPGAHFTLSLEGTKLLQRPNNQKQPTAISSPELITPPHASTHRPPNSLPHNDDIVNHTLLTECVSALKKASTDLELRQFQGAANLKPSDVCDLLVKVKEIEKFVSGLAPK